MAPCPGWGPATGSGGSWSPSARIAIPVPPPPITGRSVLPRSLTPPEPSGFPWTRPSPPMPTLRLPGSLSTAFRLVTAGCNAPPVTVPPMRSSPPPIATTTSVTPSFRDMPESWRSAPAATPPACPPLPTADPTGCTPSASRGWVHTTTVSVRPAVSPPVRLVMAWTTGGRSSPGSRDPGRSPSRGAHFPFIAAPPSAVTAVIRDLPVTVPTAALHRPWVM